MPRNCSLSLYLSLNGVLKMEAQWCPFGPMCYKMVAFYFYLFFVTFLSWCAEEAFGDGKLHDKFF